VGLVGRVHPQLSLLAEVETVLPMSLSAGKINGLGVSGGIRLPHRTWAFDLALSHPFDEKSVPLLPFAAFTLRFLP
jgi:hypothetical protein